MALQVYGDYRIPVGLFHFENGAVAQNARVIYQDVHAAEVVQCGLHQGLATADLGNGIGIRDSLAAGGSYFCHDIISNFACTRAVGITAQIVHNNFGAQGCHQ